MTKVILILLLVFIWGFTLGTRHPSVPEGGNQTTKVTCTTEGLLTGKKYLCSPEEKERLERKQ